MSSLAARQKQRSYRRRLSRGLAMLKVTAPLYPLVEAMITSGRLSPEQALCRAEIERQAAAILEEWVRQWASGSTAVSTDEIRDKMMSVAARIRR